MTSDIMDWQAEQARLREKPPVVFLWDGEVGMDYLFDLTVAVSNGNDDVFVAIHSPGGLLPIVLEAAERVFPNIRKEGKRLWTFNIGMADSAASLLLSAGDKGRRFVLAKAETGIHGPGQRSEVIRGLDREQKMRYWKAREESRGLLRETYTALTGGHVDFWHEATRTNDFTWLTPAEAKMRGLADHDDIPAWLQEMLVALPLANDGLGNR